jgi:hypothetical protein
MVQRNLPAVIAVTLTLGGLGGLVILLLAGQSGAGVWLAVGAATLGAVLCLVLAAMRRPRSTASLLRPPAGLAPRPPDDGTRRLLVVTDESCSSDDLSALPQPEGRTSAFVVAPAVSSRTSRWTGDEGAYDQAQQHLFSTVRALRALGVEAEGHIGPHDPLQAADDGLREFPADEVVFVLGGQERAQWLEEGVVHAARARYPIPVRGLRRASGTDRQPPETLR